MPQQSVFNWPDGRGWLVLAGGSDDDVRATAIERASADGGVAYVSLMPSDDALDAMQDLGAPTGYVVDVTTEDDDTLKARIGDAGIVVLGGAGTAEDFRSSLVGAAEEGLHTAHERGAMLLIEGDAVTAFGAYLIKPDGVLRDALEWLQNMIVVPGVTSVSDSETAQAVMGAQPLAVALGIGPTSALALGPDGEVQQWGDKQVTIALNQAPG